MRNKAGFGLVVLALLAVLSCSKASAPLEPPVIPQAQQTDVQAQSTSHQLWFYALLYIDPATMQIEVIPSRVVMDHWNVLKWLEKGPCTNCVSIINAQKLLNNNSLITVKITHPFDSLNLTGFDVRGIAMFKGTKTFPVSGLITSSVLKNEGEVVNADGYTFLYNSTTLGDGPNGLQGYLKGNMAVGLPNSTLNGFRTFITDDGWNLRNYFLGGTSITNDYEIHMPPLPFFLGYAVDASWVSPTVKPVVNANTDFPPEANCPEPYKVVVSEDPANNTLTDQGGSTTLIIDVYDHQGKDSYKTPTAECPELFTGALPASWVEDGVDYNRWTIDIPNTNLAASGKYSVLIAVEDNENDTAPDYLDLTAYWITTVLVTPDSALHGWAISFGGMNADGLNDTITDSAGNVYVTGFFTFTADFDPGPGEAILVANFLQDVFLASYDKFGNYRWAVHWGGEANAGQSLAFNGSDLLVYGYFMDTEVDFDPGPGVEEHDSVGGQDLFLSAFDTAGAHKWTVTWGSDDYEFPGGMSVDATGKIYLAGSYLGLTDFDTGPGVAEHTPVGGLDCFLLKLDSYGNYKWVKTWGGPEDDYALSLSGSASGESWVAGKYMDTVDFNPETPVDNHTSQGLSDAFVTRYDPNGNFKWAKTWGGDGEDDARSVVQDSLGYSWITGGFENTVDFDPGAGTANQISWGASDAYLLKLGPNGDYQWSGTMGGTEWDTGVAVAMDPIGNILLGGDYSDLADLDPGPGHAYFTAEGDTDPFLIKLSPATDFLWGDVWGGDTVLGLYVDEYSTSFVGGQFYGSADLDPGPGVDEHTGDGTDASLDVIPRTGVW
jgi:hypothetical protein